MIIIYLIIILILIVKIKILLLHGSHRKRNSVTCYVTI
jgi:hypothetical protein